MRFVFYHHQITSPFSLEQLYQGETGLAGSVCALRILFWIAALGHEVFLVGNITPGSFRGVLAYSIQDNDLELVMKKIGGKSVLVLNGTPSETIWQKIRDLKRDVFRVLLFAHNPYPLTWMHRLDQHELDGIVCVSNSFREDYRLYPGFERVEMTYVGADVDLISKAPVVHNRQFSVASTSVPRRTKGIHHLLSAWKYVRKALPSARLRIYGSARMHDPQALLGRTGLLDLDVEEEFFDFFGHSRNSEREWGIELMGMRSLNEVYCDLKSVVLTVVNSNLRGSIETYCRSAVESQLCGTPVVGAASGSLPEVVAHGKTGLLVDREDPAALADAIITLLKDDDLRHGMGAAGPTHVLPMADYSLIAREWEAIAQRAFTGETAPSPKRPVRDILRIMGYGRARLWLRDLFIHGSTFRYE